MNKPRIYRHVVRAAILGSAVIAATAMATVLPPGGTVALHGTTLAIHPYLKDTLVQDINHPITVTTPSGPLPMIYHERVTKEVVAGTLDFYFWLEAVKKPLQADKVTVSLTSFRGFATDTEYRTDGLGQAGPFQAQRDPAGALVTFTFRGVTIGNTSATWSRASYVKTNSKLERVGGIARISVDGLAPAAVKIYQP